MEPTLTLRDHFLALEALRFVSNNDNGKVNYSRTPLHRTLKGNRNWFDIAGVRYIRLFIKVNHHHNLFHTLRVYIHLKA